MNGEERKTWIAVGEASKLTGLDRQSIRKLADESSLVCYKTPSGQRRISLQSVQGMCNDIISDKEKPQVQRKNFLYARVSTKKQMDDLSRQIDFLRKPEYSTYVPIQDVGSGINFKRKGLSTILDSCLQGNIGEVIVAHKDRLCRFGFDLIEGLVTKAGGKITVLENSNNRSHEQELADDLLTIIHVFSCRQMGKRSYSSRKVKNGDHTNRPEGSPEEET